MHAKPTGRCSRRQSGAWGRGVACNPDPKKGMHNAAPADVPRGLCSHASVPICGTALCPPADLRDDVEGVEVVQLLHARHHNLAELQAQEAAAGAQHPAGTAAEKHRALIQ